MNLFRKNNRKPFEEQLEKQLGDMEYKPSKSLWDRIDSGMSSDGFEAPVRSKLDRFEQIPYPETWKKIESRLPVQQQPLRRFVLFGLAFVTLVGVVATGYWLNTASESQPQLVSAPVATETDDQIDLISPENTETIEGRAIQSQPAQSSQIHSAAPEQAEPEVQQTSKPIDVEQAHTVTPRQTGTNKESKPTVSSSPKTERAAQPAKVVVLAATAEPVTKPTAPQTPQSHQPSAQSPIATQTPVPTQAADQTQASSPAQPATLATAAPLLIDTPKQQAVAPTAMDTSAHIKGREIVNGSLMKPDSTVATAATDRTADPLSEDEFTRFSISVFGGMSLSGTTYSNPKNSNLNFDENIKLRKEIERAQVEWSGGFMLDYRINDRWMISSGLSMVNFNQKVQYDIDSAVVPGNPSDIGAPIQNPGDSFLVGNTYSNRLKYTWTEIPLYVNYTVHRGNLWDIDIQGGVGYGFINTIDGGMVSYDNKGVLVLKDKESFPQISNTVFMTLQPQVSRKFGEGVSVGIVPSFKYSVTSIIGNDAWVQQHPYFIGLSACIRKRF